MSYNLNITRNNFKQQREAYNISLKEIADICNLSTQTVMAFEKSRGRYTDVNARDYNSDMMINTLESLITKKLDEIKNKNLESVIANDISKKKPVSNGKKLGGIYADSDIPRQKLVDYILAYCKENALSTIEFCKMCKINRTYTSPSSAKISNREYVTVGVLKRVLDTTGWKKEQILAGFKQEEKSAFKLKLVDKKETDIPKHGDLVNKTAEAIGAKLTNVKEESKEIVNVRYICENGVYRKEYDIIRHMVVDISKEQFLKEVST